MTTTPISVTADVTGTIEMKQAAVDPPPSDPSALDEDDRAVLKEARAANVASLTAFHASLITIASGSVDRARAGATATVTAASAIATVYAGLLALVFNAGGTALPTRALLAPIFFAVAIALATAYMAFITPSNVKRKVDESGGWGAKAYNRVAFFISYTRAIVLRRVWMLQAAVIALAIAIIGIALPFVAPGAQQPAATTDTAVAVDWPRPGASSGDPALDALLYDAQLKQAVAVADAQTKAENEAATAKAAADAQQSWMDSPLFFWLALAIGLLLVLGVPWVIARRARRRQQTPSPAG